MLGKVFSKIISSGQAGVNLAALDVALELGIACGGRCLMGRRAEDGPIEPKYALKETKSEEYPFRTEANVINADRTLILRVGHPSEGNIFPLQMNIKHKKPVIVFDLQRKFMPEIVLDWA